MAHQPSIIRAIPASRRPTGQVFFRQFPHSRQICDAASHFVTARPLHIARGDDGCEGPGSSWFISADRRLDKLDSLCPGTSSNLYILVEVSSLPDRTYKGGFGGSYSGNHPSAARMPENGEGEQDQTEKDNNGYIF